DEKAIADTLIHTLEMDGFSVVWFDTAGAGLSYIKATQIDLLILDVGLPDANGFELCKQVREFSSLPIIFLTARNDEIDRVVGLEIGA
ncbi:response regulator, partial [Burkholderia sp. SIMBA_051]